MSGGAVCPACGVAVVPGYVRCPKCHKPLPAPARRITKVAEGGTAVASGEPRTTIAIIAVAVVAIGFIAYLGLRGGTHAATAPAPGESPAQPPTQSINTPGATASQAPPDRPVLAAAPHADRIAADLERTLKKQRLWSTVDVVGGRVEVRSGSCSDPAMGRALDGARGAFKAAGLTKLRCVEQSGQVVFERDL